MGRDVVGFQDILTNSPMPQTVATRAGHLVGSPEARQRQKPCSGGQPRGMRRIRLLIVHHGVVRRNHRPVLRGRTKPTATTNRTTDHDESDDDKHYSTT